MCSRVAWPSLLGMSGSGSIRAMDGNRFKGGDSWTTEHLYMSVSHPSSSLEHICVLQRVESHFTRGLRLFDT